MEYPRKLEHAAHFETVADLRWLPTIKGIGRAARTLFNVPELDTSLYQNVAIELRYSPQPTQPPIQEEAQKIEKQLTRSLDDDPGRTLSVRERLGYLGVFMQFSTHVPNLRPYARTPYKHVEELYNQCTTDKRAPLTFSEQVDIAVRQTGGNLPEALWRLFVTSRQYARWFDEDIIDGMPNFTYDEKLQRMYDWSSSVAACKPYGTCLDQDASGDTYYTWTHTLGKVVLKALAPKETPITKASEVVIHNGTSLMHSLAHKYKAQTLPSDHTKAAAYGNAIGNVCVEVMRPGI